MLYINTSLNSIVINQEEFDINRNYLPDIFMALGELDNKRKIKIAIDLKKTPVIFVLYFRKLLLESGIELDIYYKDKSEALRKSLKDYGMQYKNIKKYPDILP